MVSNMKWLVYYGDDLLDEIEADYYEDALNEAQCSIDVKKKVSRKKINYEYLRKEYEDLRK